MIEGELAKRFVERALRVKVCEPFSGLLIFDKGKPSGACVFNNYNGRDVHFTCVSSGLLTMRTARMVAHYVFVQLGCHRCTAVTRGTNGPAIKALGQLGFRYEGTLREHFEDSDGAVFGLLRSEQKIVRI